MRYRIAIMAVIAATMLSVGACGGEENASGLGDASCQPTSLATISKDLSDAGVQKRVRDAVTIARSEDATKDQIVALVAIGYSESAFGGRTVPDSDSYDMFSQRIEKGIDADPNTSVRNMLARIKKYSGTPAQIAQLAARPAQYDRYASSVPIAEKIVTAVGGC